MKATFVPITDPAALLVLEKYRHWINKGFEDEPRGYNPVAIEMEDFFKWESTFILNDFTQGDRFRHLIIWADQGDDGGGSLLMAYFYNIGWEKPEWELKSIVHEFDTAIRQIYGSEYISGKIGWSTRDFRVEEVEALGLKMGEQIYSPEEQELQAKRPVVQEA